MSKIIKSINPEINIESNAKPPRSGAFEVTIDGKLVYSKFKTGNFPQKKDIMMWLK